MYRLQTVSIFFASATIAFIGCSGGAAVKPALTDEILRQDIPGTWITDDHASEGDKLGDGEMREITVWTFRPDGTWSNYVGNNNQDTFTRILYGGLSVFGNGLNGRWWVNNLELHVECTGSVNPIADLGLSGKELVRFGGRVRSFSKQQMLTNNCVYHRVNPANK
jgi:hypothetical protein